MKKKWIAWTLMAAVLLAGCGEKEVDTGGTAGGQHFGTHSESVDDSSEAVSSDSKGVFDNFSKDTEHHDEDKHEEEEHESGHHGSGNAAIDESEFAEEVYTYQDRYGTAYLFVALENQSGKNANVRIEATAYDSSNKEVGDGVGTLDVIGDGEQSLVTVYIGEVEDLDHVDYTFEAEEEDYYKPVVGNMDVTGSGNAGNLTLVVTNNGDVPAQYVEAYALFFDEDDNLIDYGWNYISDANMELKPGVSMGAQLDVYEEDYDYGLWYLSGCYTGSDFEAADIDESKIDVKSYEEKMDDGMIQEFLVVTNNTDKVLTIAGNAIIWGSEDEPCGSANTSIDILGPGETTCTYFYFSNVYDGQKVEYSLSYSEDVYYDPVIGDISLDVQKTDGGVTVKATNNGDKVAEFVSVTALFFDADGNVIGDNYGYCIDDDDQLKPGKTEETELSYWGDKTVDHVEVYCDGRADK